MNLTYYKRRKMARKLDYDRLPTYDVWSFNKLMTEAKTASRYDGMIETVWMREALSAASLEKDPHKALDAYNIQAKEINAYFELVKTFRWYDEKEFWKGHQPRKCDVLD